MVTTILEPAHCAVEIWHQRSKKFTLRSRLGLIQDSDHFYQVRKFRVQKEDIETERLSGPDSFLLTSLTYVKPKSLRRASDWTLRHHKRHNPLLCLREKPWPKEPTSFHFSTCHSGHSVTSKVICFWKPFGWEAPSTQNLLTRHRQSPILIR